jgi:AcrR family transcriptional regulator
VQVGQVAVVPTPRRLPKGQGHVLRAEILRATVELLDDTGSVDAVSTRAIAQRVGRSTPLIYEHFADRDELLRSAARSALEHMGEQIEASLAGETDVAQRLRRRAHAYVDFARRHPEPYRILFMDRRYSSGTQLDALLATTGFAGVTRDLDNARANGLMISADTRLVTLTFWASLHGVASLLLTHPNMDWPPTLLDALLDQLRDGLTPRENAPTPPNRAKPPARRRRSST